MLPRKPPLPFVPGHKHLHHRGWPCHAYGAASLLRRIPVFLFGRHPDDYLTRLRGERSGDGTESFDARAVFGQQQHPLSRIGHEGRPVLAESHLFTNCIDLEPAERLGDRDLSGQDLERLLIEIRVLRLQSVAILLHKAEDVRPVSLLFSTSASSFTSPYGNNRESRKVCDGVRDSVISSEPTPYPHCALPTQRLTVEMPIPKVRSIRALGSLACVK